MSWVNVAEIRMDTGFPAFPMPLEFDIMLGRQIQRSDGGDRDLSSGDMRIYLAIEVRRIHSLAP